MSVTSCMGDIWLGFGWLHGCRGSGYADDGVKVCPG